MSKTHNAGIVTAYGAAVRGGYTGTYEQFCAQQAQYAENARQMEQAVSDVRQIKTSVESAVSEAETHANNASQSATNASNSATQASESASNANQSANNASSSADSASQSASSAQTSANNASTSEQNAHQSAEDAHQSVEDAQDILESVQTEGNTQIGRVQAKGNEILNSLPSDFTHLGVYDIEWEMGRYSVSGADVSSDTYIRSKTDQPIAVTPGDTIFLGGVNNNAVFSAYYYNSANIFVSYVTDTYYMNVITIPDGVSFVKITARKTTKETITTDYGKNIIVLRFNGDIAKAAAAFGGKAPRLCQGMCTPIAASTDYNTLTEYGNYIPPSTTADRKTLVNAPTVENHVLYVFNFFSGGVIQVAMANSKIPTVYYRIRRFAGELFSAWYKVADSADINALQSNINNKLGVYDIEWEMGRYSVSGADVSSDTYIRSKTDQPIAVTPGDTIIPYMDSNSSLAVYFYKKTGSAITFNSYISETNGVFTIPSDVNLMKVTSRKNPAETITTDYGKRLALYNANGVLMRPIFQKFDEPMLTIIDDDSNKRFYNDLYGVFALKNVPIASAVITGRVGTSGYMTWAEITECYENGIEILSHSNRHFLRTDSDFESLTENDIVKDYLIAKHKLNTHGIYDDLLVFSGSTGLYAKFNTAAQRVYKGAFLAGDNRTNHQFGDKYKIYRYRVGNQTDYHCDLDVLKGLIDSVKSTGGWMIWMTHTSGGPDDWTPGTGEGSSAYILGEAVDYAVSQKVPIVTAEHGFTKYFSSF